MLNQYSKIREKFAISGATDPDNSLASFTHFLQCNANGISNYFRPKAVEFLANWYKTNQTLPWPAENFLDLDWDVPFPPVTNRRFTFVDLFAGIGGIRLAYQNLGGKCVFSSEWNKFAKVTYERNFGEVPFGDITSFDERDIPEHDVLLAGFPCQPFSIAGVSKKASLGRQHGFLDAAQGTLFFDIARILREKRPQAFMLENVKNLLTHDRGRTFDVISKTLQSLGYSVHYKVLDGKHFVPQHRERIFIVGFRLDTPTAGRFTFPHFDSSGLSIRKILEPDPHPKYTLTPHLWEYLQEYAAKHKAKGNGFGFGMADLDGISRTLSARYYKDGAEILIPQEGKAPRRLTPRECARIQGFPDKFEIPVSDAQAYKQFGNSVVVPLVQSVGAQVAARIVELNESH